MVRFNRGLSVQEIMQKYSASNSKLTGSDFGAWVLVQNLGNPTLEFVNGDQKLWVSLYLKNVDESLEPNINIPQLNLQRSIVWSISLHASIHSSHPAHAIFNKLFSRIGFLLKALDDSVYQE